MEAPLQLECPLKILSRFPGMKKDMHLRISAAARQPHAEQPTKKIMQSYLKRIAAEVCRRQRCPAYAGCRSTEFLFPFAGQLCRG